MIEKKEIAYTLARDDSIFVFRTTRFVTDKGSVLHSGIYNREFSSVLASFAFAGAVYFVLVKNFGEKTFFYLVFTVLFIGTFPLFVRFVFRERWLETVLDKHTGTAVLSLGRMRKKVLDNLPLTSITGLRIDTKKAEVVNRDGVEFIEKISAMHGTVIPGFGDEAVFYSLKLQLTDGTDRTVFADRNMHDVMAVYDDMKEFLKI